MGHGHKLDHQAVHRVPPLPEWGAGLSDSNPDMCAHRFGRRHCVRIHHRVVRHSRPRDPVGRAEHHVAWHPNSTRSYLAEHSITCCNLGRTDRDRELSDHRLQPPLPHHRRTELDDRDTNRITNDADKPHCWLAVRDADRSNERDWDWHLLDTTDQGGPNRTDRTDEPHLDCRLWASRVELDRPVVERRTGHLRLHNHGHSA